MTSSTATLKAAEDFVARLDEEEAVQAAKARALELRAKAGEASLRLSERASDSAESVLKAAILLRELNSCLHDARSDLRSSKRQLEQLEAELLQPSTSAVAQVVSNTPPQASPSADSSVRLQADDFFEEKRKATERLFAYHSTNAHDWSVCLSRISQALFETLEVTSRESLQHGWIRQFADWSSKRVKWFVSRIFFSLTFSSTWSMSSMSVLKGEELSENQWMRLAEAVKICVQELKSFGYIFLVIIEPVLQSMASSLLSRAELDSRKYTDLSQPEHPFRRAISRIVPLFSIHRVILESMAPLCISRTQLLLQQLDESHRHEGVLELNRVLLDAKLRLD